MAPLPTSSAEYQTLLQWIVRTAYLIDGKVRSIWTFEISCVVLNLEPTRRHPISQTSSGRSEAHSLLIIRL